MTDDERALLDTLEKLLRAQAEAITLLGHALTSMQHSHQAISDWLQKLAASR